MKKYCDCIFVLALSVIILGVSFFLEDGTYFFLDGIFIPFHGFDNFFEVSLYFHINNLFTLIFGYKLYSKIFLFFIIFFYGIFGLKFSGFILKKLGVGYKNIRVFRYLGVLFFLLNPFFYERIITQPGISLGVLFLGVGIYFLLKNSLDFSNKNFFYSGVCFAFAFATFPHAIFMIFLVYFLYLIFYLREKKYFLPFILSSLFILIINFNWFLGNFFFNSGETVNYLQVINQDNIENFTTNSLSGLGEELTSLLLYGFWGEKWGHLYLPNMVNEKWYISGLLILLIIFYGFVKFFKKNKKFSLFLFSLGFFAYIFGVGVTAKWGSINQFLFDYIPFYNGMREPQKWIGILMIVYFVFFVSGIYFLSEFFKKYINFKYFDVVFFVIIFLFLNGWSPNVLFSFNSQLIITDYPSEYFQLKEDELENTQNKYLVLPWHSYLECDYTYGKVISNVMGDFFAPLQLITSDNIEVGNLYSNSLDPRSKDIESFLENNDLELLKKHNITHIVMLETCGDFKRYDEILENLFKKKLLNKKLYDEKISVYEIK